MIMEHAILFFIIVVIQGVTSAYVNQYDKPVLFQCPTGESISSISSKHHNRKEDRRFDYGCSHTHGLRDCKWHGYANDFDDPVLFQCPNNGVISGVSSIHNNKKEDRKFKYYCCSLERTRLMSCSFSNYANDFDKEVNYRLSSTRVLKGVFSYHDGHHEDRRFKFETCTVE